MPEFIADGRTGFLVPPGDLQAMAERTIALLDDPLRAKQMGQAAFKMAASHSNRRFVAEHEAFYASLVRTPVEVPQFVR